MINIMTPLFRLAIVCASIAFFSACNNNRPLEVMDLVKNASSFNGQLVTVRGCYSRSEEATILHSCTQPTMEEAIWILPYTQIENSAKWVAGYDKKFRKPEKEPSAEENRLAMQISKMLNGSPINVVMRGEFQYSEKPQFGHDGAYRYELVLHRVLSAANR